MKPNFDPIAQENLRIQAEYQRREIEVKADKYAPWEPAQNLMVFERKRIAASLLKKIERFPVTGKHCLEIGYGKLGWLADLISWGLKESDLYGIELDASRAKKAQEALPKANLKVGDATNLPWENDYFDLIIVSTVFSSILNKNVRDLIAKEIYRVLSPQGALVWYDLAVNNPQNSAVRGMKKQEIRKQFPLMRGSFKSVTLAPPIARLVSERSWTLATVLSSIPFLRTHWLAVLIKN